MSDTYRNNATRFRVVVILLVCLFSGVDMAHANDQVTVDVVHP